MSMSANDVLFGSGVPAASFKSPGDTFAGPILKLEAVQVRKFDKKTNRPTDELEYWDNGDPRMQAVVTLKTDHRDPSDPSDDGQRKLYIASRDMQNKLKSAVKAAGKRALDVGGFLSVTYTHEAPSEAGPMAKFYEVAYTPAGAAQANAALGVTERIQETARAYEPAPQGYQTTVIQPQAAVPSVQQMIQPDAAPAATNLDNLPPEARALVERMLAGQQQS